MITKVGRKRLDPVERVHGVVAGAGPGDAGVVAMVGGEDGEAVVGEVAGGAGPVGPSQRTRTRVHPGVPAARTRRSWQMLHRLAT